MSCDPRSIPRRVIARARSARGDLVLLALLVVPGSPVAAQTMRDFEYARPYRGERTLKASVEFAAGTLQLGPSVGEQLYHLKLHYDADRFQPVGSADAAGVVRLGVSGNGGGGIRVERKSALAQTAAIELSRAAALSLDVSVGAAEATLELGGLRLAELVLKSGASHTTVGFREPNPAICRSAAVTSGAGEVSILQAGNSGCPVWYFDGGVGSVTLDLAGAWPSDARIRLNMALGGVKLLAPRELGLRVRMDGFLSRFDASGFTRSGKTYTSAGYARATRKLEVEVSSALGGVSVEWRE
jgi:hypothetical protein